MERIIRDKIMTHMTDNAMFGKAQQGALVTQLLEVIESWTMNDLVCRRSDGCNLL